MLKTLGRIFFFCGFLFFTQGAQAATNYPYSGWRTVDTPHFSIHYYRPIENIAKKAASIFEDVYGRLTPKYNWKPKGRTQIVLTDVSDDANGLATTIPYNWIILRIVPPEPESPIGTYDDWLKTVITHEFTHILHLDAYRGLMKLGHLIFGKFAAPAGFTPAWIKEGTATLEETLGTRGGRGRSAYAEMILRTAVLNHQFPTIDRAAGLHWKWPGNLLPYVMGVKFLDHLRERYGEDKLLEFHRRVQGSIWIGAINHQAKRVFGKSFYKLWNEWKVSLEQKYQDWEKDLKAEGVAEPSLFIGGENSFHLPTLSPDGNKLVYVVSSPKRATTIWIKDLETGKSSPLAKRAPNQIHFSPDGSEIVFSAIGSTRRYYNYYDLYRLDLKTKKIRRLTTGARAKDPAFHPDGNKIVYVAHQPEGDSLKVYDLQSKESQTLVDDAGPFAQFAQPTYSPDGKEIALVRFRNEEGWELCIYGADGTFKQKVTHNGLSVDSRPVWTSDGRRIIFSSAADGVFNLYSFDRQTKGLQRLTRVTTGIFQPTISKEGKMLLARYYNGAGFDIRRVPFQTGEKKKEKADKRKMAKVKKVKKGKVVSSEVPEKAAGSLNFPEDPSWRIRKYNPLGKPFFVPRYILPGGSFLGNGFLFSAAIGGQDPLQYHRWFAGGTYRTDANYLGYFAEYAFTRYLPIFGAGIDDSAADLGTISFNNGNSYHFFEESRRAYSFFSIPFGAKQAVGLSYFYEKRLPITSILPTEAAALNLGAFAGLNATYVYGTREAYPASISPVEKGRHLRLVGTVTNARLGSNERNEQKIFFGDYREYISLGNNHVMALRVAGGIAAGDRVFPGTFSLGGSLGEGTLAGSGSSRYFSLRGLPTSFLVADRAMLISAEYRLPLVSPQRGLGTWPIFLNNLHMGFFADYGDAWGPADGVSKEGFKDFFNDFLLGTGLELRADLVVGHGVPVTGRLGYGVIVVNRSRLGTTRDPLLNNLISKGVLVLQWGTSF